MPIVTMLRPARGRTSNLDLALDGTPVGAVPATLVAPYQLTVGSEIDDDTAAALISAAQLVAALTLANTFLAHRPRSEEEVRQRLRRAGHNSGTVDAALTALRAQGLLDDRRFAELWVESRRSFSPRSGRLLAFELRRKGVQREEIEAVLESEGADEVEAACAAGRARLRAWAALDEPTFSRRMGAFLARRGFSREVVARAVTVLWAESHGQS
jgi:regulatory protein